MSDKSEALRLEAETVSGLMAQLAENDIDCDSFAVMSDLGENGTEHECDLPITETALRASAVIDQLLAALEEKGQEAKRSTDRLRELESDLADRGGIIAEQAKRIAELEQPLKLPDLRKQVSGERYVWSDGLYNYRTDLVKMLKEQGHKVEE